MIFLLFVRLHYDNPFGGLARCGFGVPDDDFMAERIGSRLENLMFGMRGIRAVALTADTAPPKKWRSCRSDPDWASS
jgi:hypothetical protein